MEESIIEREVSVSCELYLAMQQLKRKLLELQQIYNKCRYNEYDRGERFIYITSDFASLPIAHLKRLCTTLPVFSIYNKFAIRM